MDLALAIEEIRPGAEYRLNHSVADGTQVIVEWRGPDDEPTQQELDDAWKVYSDRKKAEQATSDVLKANIRAIAQSAEGVSLIDLTQGQIKSLLAVLLWKAGAVADDMTIKALGEWTR